MNNFIKYILSQKFHNKYKRIILLLSLILMACNDSNHPSNFEISNIAEISTLRTENPSLISFTLSSNKTITSVELTYSLVSIKDNPAKVGQTYSLGVGVANFQDLEASIQKILIIPASLTDGKYQLNVTIEEVDGEQGVVTQSETKTLEIVDIVTPTQPELVVKLAKLNNHSFSLQVIPDDGNQILTKRGDILLDLILQPKYRKLTGNMVMEFELNLDGIGTFPLDLTSKINTRGAGGTDNHRNVTADGKVIERVKGQSRTISEHCITLVNNIERCATIGQNRNRHFNIDLHLNENTFNLLNSHAQDVKGKIVGRVHADELSDDIEFQLPIIYLHDNKNAKVNNSKVSKSSSSASENEVDEIQTTDSGDDEYIYHETTSSANTFTDSDGQAYSEQSQDVSLSMGNQDGSYSGDGASGGEGQTVSMASMTSTVSSDKSGNIEDTAFGMG